MAYIIFLFSILALVWRNFYMKKESLDLNTVNYKDCSEPKLYTLYGTGFMFKGSYRETNPSNEMILKSHSNAQIFVTYYFFCIGLLPIIPIRAYLVREDERKGYYVLGTVETDTKEVFGIYVTYYAWITFVFSALIILSSI